MTGSCEIINRCSASVYFTPRRDIRYQVTLLGSNTSRDDRLLSVHCLFHLMPATMSSFTDSCQLYSALSRLHSVFSDNIMPYDFANAYYCVDYC